VSKIKILPEILSNKIAAGEVVERPSSVVKELVENSLDADSTRIIIEVERGGRSLIRVSDNGTGMSSDDALLSIERYATSKIYKDADLFSIKTLGFRGEALPSIASVSRFTLETRDQGSSVGTRIEIEGGKIRKVSEAGVPAGTLITVRDIFFNTPVRRKFLKTINTEMSHIADTLANIAVGWTHVHFRLNHNSRTVKNWTPVSDPSDRAADVLGKEMKNELQRVNASDEIFSLSGWIASPRISRSTSRGIYVYVNGRCVQDRTVQHALFEGYEGRLMKGQFPMAVLFICAAPDQVDVNVHPRKNEVRFLQQNRIHSLVKNAVSSVLNLADRNLFDNHPPPLRSDTPPLPTEISEPFSGFNPPLPKMSLHNEEQPVFSESSRISPEQTRLWKKNRFSDMKIIGQFQGTYIICESGDGLVLIDQHAAHERILFEQLKSRASVKTRQTLLIPETLDLSHTENDILETLLPAFEEIGFEIEPFGGNTSIVKSVPALLIGREISPLITEIVEKAAVIGLSAGIDRIKDECLMLTACHAAVRANQELSEKEIKALLHQLEECENPSHCPHGRPIWIQWTMRSLEKSFNRIV